MKEGSHVLCSRKCSKLEDDRVNHGAETLDDCAGHELVHVVLQVLLGIYFANIHDLHFLLRATFLFLHTAAVVLGQTAQTGQQIRHLLLMLLVLAHLQPCGPVLLVQIHEHLLLQIVLPPVDHQRVVVSVQAVDAGLDGRLLQEADVGSRLSRLCVYSHHQLVLPSDHAECVNDHFSLHALHGVHHYGNLTQGQYPVKRTPLQKWMYIYAHRTRIELLE